MTERSVAHATFTIEREYDAAPARVFAAWADPDQRARWEAIGEGWESTYDASDFRVGGREVSRFSFNSDTFTADGVWQDIVPDTRIVYAYTMARGDTRISASLTTVEMSPSGAGTRLTLTEQMAVLDGGDDPADREQGTRGQLEQLATFLTRQAG